MKLTSLAPFFVLALTCHWPAASCAAEPTTNAAPKSYLTRGLVRSIAPDLQTALIRHEAIPDYMPAMTMELNVRDTNELSDITVGDTISFRLLVDDDTHWIDQLKKSAATSTNTPPPLPTVQTDAGGDIELKPGDLMPDAELIDEHGKTIRFSQFRGQAVAFTFFFTRCPLPDYCPLMCKQFAAARSRLLAAANAPTNWTLLAISFDSEFDKPAVLAGYARSYRGDDPTRWLFASASNATLKNIAPRIDLMIARDGPGFSHNLRTIVLDTRGRIHRQFDGNRWKASELADAIREAAAVPPGS